MLCACSAPTQVSVTCKSLQCNCSNTSDLQHPLASAGPKSSGALCTAQPGHLHGKDNGHTCSTISAWDTRRRSNASVWSTSCSAACVAKPRQGKRQGGVTALCSFAPLSSSLFDTSGAAPQQGTHASSTAVAACLASVCAARRLAQCRSILTSLQASCLLSQWMLSLECSCPLMH